jgi:hypothetical protein
MKHGLGFGLDLGFVAVDDDDYDNDELDGFNLHTNIRSTLFRNLRICPTSIFFFLETQMQLK